MNPHDATEQAYRNGYNAGYKAAKAEYFNLTPEDVAYLLKFFKERTSTSSITAEMKIAAELIELEKLRKEKDNAIEHTPACDVVEIVRCKDCVYSYFVSQYSKYECSRLGILLFSDDFCSFGERKEENE